MDVTILQEGLGPKRSPCHGCAYAAWDKKNSPCDDCRARKIYDDSLGNPFNEVPVRRMCRNGCPEAEMRLGLCWRCLEKEAPDPFVRPSLVRRLPIEKEEPLQKLAPGKIGKKPCVMGGCPETAVYADGYCELCKRHRKERLRNRAKPRQALSPHMVGNRIRHFTTRESDPVRAGKYRELLETMREGR